MNITYGEHSIDFSKLPEASVRAMLQRGVTHFLGSEQASKVSTKFKDADEATNTDEARASFKAECVAKALAALNEGTVGVSTRGSAADPLEAEIERITKREVVAVLKGQGLKFPKDGESVKFGNGTVRTGDEMLTNYSAKHGDRIRKEAEAALKEKARAAKKLAEKTADATTGDL
jgi:hypothetical protein